MCRKTAFLLLLLVLLNACTVKKLVQTPAYAGRGDAVFSLIVPNNNYGEIEDIHIYAWTQGGVLNVNRVLIDFDLKKIPTNAIIEKAYLNLYFNSTSVYNRRLGGKGSQGGDSIVIQRVISDWDENSVTWNTQPQTTEEGQILLEKKVDPYTDYLGIEVTKLIRDVIMSKEKWYGIMLRQQNEQPYNVVYFASSEHPQKNLHPELIVYYRKEK